jgi:hypothetical protein
LLIANLDKLTPALKPGGPAATAIPLLLSMLVGGAIKIISGYAGFVLSVEGGIPEAVQPILVEETNRQLNERGIQQNQPQYGQEAPITSKAIMSPLVLEFVQTQPRFVRWAAEMGMRHVDKDILVGIKLPARIYFWMLLGLAIQSFTLTFAIVLPLLLIR